MRWNGCARRRSGLREAMKNGASEAEIARLMDELREATRDYLEQLQREFCRAEPA